MHYVNQLVITHSGLAICNDDKFTAESVDERIMKIGQHLAKLRVRV